MARRPTRLLVATRHNPFPENDGAGAYIFDFLGYLASHGFEIEVVWLQAEGSITRSGHWRIPNHFSKVARLQIIGGHKLGQRIFFPQIHWLPFKAKCLSAIKTTLQVLRLGFILNTRQNQKAALASTSGNRPSVAPQWSSLPNNEESAFFQQRLRAFHPDTVLVNFCWLAPLLENLPGHITKVIETNDVVSQRIPPTPGLPIDPATPAGEAALLSCAQHILAISEDDAASFRARLPNQSIILMPKAAIPRPLGPATDPVRILFVGGANAFNHEGIQWFLNEVWPSVCRSRPDVQLHICGGICVMLSSVPEGVILRGRVADLTQEYAAAAVVIVPLLQGSGVKIKLVEAASYGKAIVTTPVGLQGLGFLSASVIEAAQPNDFGAGVLRLLNEQALQEKLSQTILQQVEKHLSHEGAYGPARQVLTGSHP